LPYHRSHRLAVDHLCHWRVSPGALAHGEFL
jgi:hypothetical protein